MLAAPWDRLGWEDFEKIWEAACDPLKRETGWLTSCWLRQGDSRLLPNHYFIIQAMTSRGGGMNIVRCRFVLVVRMQVIC